MDSISKTNKAYFIAALMCNYVTYLIHTKRWSLFFKSENIRFKDFYHCVVIGHLLNTILPSKSGEIIRPYYLSKLHNLNYVKTLTTCFSERLLDAIIILIIVITGSYYFGQAELYALMNKGVSVLALAICLIILVITIIIKTSLLTKIVTRLKFKGMKIIQPLLEKIQEGFRLLEDRKSLLKIVLYTILYWMAGSLTMYFLLKSCPIPEQLQTFTISIFIGGAMGVSLSLPSAPANIGIYSYTLFTVFTLILNIENIELRAQEESALIAATVIIHLGSIIPDFLLGLYSYFKLSGKVFFPTR